MPWLLLLKISFANLFLFTNMYYKFYLNANAVTSANVLTQSCIYFSKIFHTKYITLSIWLTTCNKTTQISWKGCIFYYVCSEQFARNHFAKFVQTISDNYYFSGLRQVSNSLLFLCFLITDDGKVKLQEQELIGRLKICRLWLFNIIWERIVNLS